MFAAALLSICLLAAPAQSGASPDVNARVEALYSEGVALYRAGKFRLAIEKFQAAYALYPEPNLLYNEARALEAIGEQPQALDVYRRALDHDEATDDLKSKSRARIVFLETVIRNSERASEPQKAAVSPSESAPTSSTSPSTSTIAAPAAAEEDEGSGAGLWIAAGVVGALAVGAGVAAAVLLVPGPAYVSTVPQQSIAGE